MKTILAVALTVALAACSEAPKPPQIAKPAAPTPAAPESKAAEALKPDPNQELAARVKKALEEEANIQAAAIDVTASAGVVTLWGTAASADERGRMAQVAAKVEGVKSVENKLAIVKGS
jgi:osmotically-inducible protein OsmY